MSTSVGTKAKKKQSTLSQPNPLTTNDRGLQSALLSLENACLSVMDSRFSDSKQDTEGLYWQQRFINIVTPVSLALMECKGPRHFHYHYRHRAGDESILQPVLENPVEMLAHVCRQALKECQGKLVGIHDPAIIHSRRRMENALSSFLLRYEEFAQEVE